ncbi:hypothetical protein SISNIDRAFT_453387 [Sistotremastrum niveocremeum HHB9708]|uniref:DUF6533 domain-containing protein n=1 Tax=Sistotremastrum niveocremeum HHB9708 TaxID=1314777 RepID=A0A164VTX8_9AGAM|nr:hypothetical protein SISNIDRAFT_453387 [Sistotremastrum niveocremeum HHB9708]
MAVAEPQVQQAAEATATALFHLTAARYFQLSAFAMLLYDHMITFSDEVERIWKQPFQFPTLLFALNRYVTPLQRIVIVVAFNDPDWSMEVSIPFLLLSNCRRSVRFSGGGTLALVSMIMILRVYALYRGNIVVLAVLLCSLIAQVALASLTLVESQGMSFLTTLLLNLTCILVGKGPFFAAFWGSPLLTDLLIFSLTVWKAWRYHQAHVKTPILTVCIRDGILYFAVIFAANLLNFLMYLLASPGIKAIGASFSQLITSLMISRLQLNLRGLKDSRSSRCSRPLSSTILVSDENETSTTALPSTTTSSGIIDTMLSASFYRIVGNLGEDFEDDSRPSSTQWGGDEDKERVDDEPEEGYEDVALQTLPRRPEDPSRWQSAWIADEG